MGEIGILNVGAGDTKLVFDKSNPAETIRAARIVRDMLRRGYALLIKLEDGTHTRVKDFDEGTNEYIIADFDPVEAMRAEEADLDETDTAGEEETPPLRKAPKKKGSRTRRVAADRASGVAVSRTAGG